MIRKNSMIVGTTAAALLQVISGWGGSQGNSFAAGTKKPATKTTKSATGAANVPSDTPAKNNYNAAALHRLDFKVKGSSCPVCITGIRKRMQSAPGVVQAAIMIKQPYAGVLIYDSSKTTQEALFAKGLETTKNVTMANVEDVKISKIPELLVPHIGEPEPAASE